MRKQQGYKDKKKGVTAQGHNGLTAKKEGERENG